VARIVLLLVLSGVVTLQVPIPAGFSVVDLNPIRSGAVLVMLWLWIIAWRVIDRRLLRPARGDIWWGLVPYQKGSYDEGEQHAKVRPCLVVSTFPRHAYVLKITSQDKSERRDHIEMPVGWHPRSDPDKESWLQLRPLIKVPYYNFREHIRTCPECLWGQINERYPPDATPEPRTPPARPAARTPPRRTDKPRPRGR
jgi:PemK-like, MazF-like toxin of type II toxin-antitoxin system